MNTEEPENYQSIAHKSDTQGSPKPAIVTEKSLIAEPVKLALIFILILAVSYLCYDKYRTENARDAEIANLMGRIERLEVSHDVSTAAFSSKVSNLESGLEQAVEDTKKRSKEPPHSYRRKKKRPGRN